VRISAEKLAALRNERSSRILITGGTGFLGSHLAAWLLESGYRIVMVARPSREASAAERVRSIMDWHGVSERALRRLRVVQGDLLDPALGLDSEERRRLREETDEIIHCASDTSFAERKRARIEKINLLGSERMLDIAAAGRCAAFHYLSTVFVAGRHEEVCRETLSAAGEFNNPYEETKCRAEWSIWRRCRDEGIVPIIYRPSVVYGHSVTGRSLLFNALYHPVRAVAMLRDIYLRDIRRNDGAKARAAGVIIGSDGTLHLPLRVETESPGIDLIPVDFFTAAFASLFNAAVDGGIFHIVSGRPTPAATVVAYINRMFGLSGIEAVSPADMIGTDRNAIESAFLQMIDVYRPYLSDRRVFMKDTLDVILKNEAMSCPPFTYEVFHRCMNYAIDVNWRSERDRPASIPGQNREPGRLTEE
jgi:nucleoside-diphosphate-sugar epimerase